MLISLDLHTLFNLQNCGSAY